MFKNWKRDLVVLVIGAVGSFGLYEGWYYYEVLRWVDNIRIAQAIQQAQQQAQKQAQPTPQPSQPK